jgi:hypothetical protein
VFLSSSRISSFGILTISLQATTVVAGRNIQIFWRKKLALFPP